MMKDGIESVTESEKNHHYVHFLFCSLTFCAGMHLVVCESEKNLVLGQGQGSLCVAPWLQKAIQCKFSGIVASALCSNLDELA